MDPLFVIISFNKLPANAKTSDNEGSLSKDMIPNGKINAV